MKYLKHLSLCTRLQKLCIDIDSRDFKPKHYQHIGQLTSLRTLSLSAHLPLDGFRALAPLSSLQSLSCICRGKDLHHLSSLKKLQQLDFVHGSDIAGADLAALANASELTTLNINSHSIKAEDLQGLVRLTQLQYLKCRSNQITDNDLEHLVVMTQLKNVELSSGNITDEGIKKHQAQLKHVIIKK